MREKNLCASILTKVFRIIKMPAQIVGVEWQLFSLISHSVVCNVMSFHQRDTHQIVRDPSFSTSLSFQEEDKRET